MALPCPALLCLAQRAAFHHHLCLLFYRCSASKTLLLFNFLITVFGLTTRLITYLFSIVQCVFLKKKAKNQSKADDRNKTDCFTAFLGSQPTPLSPHLTFLLLSQGKAEVMVLLKSFRSLSSKRDFCSKPALRRATSRTSLESLPGKLMESLVSEHGFFFGGGASSSSFNEELTELPINPAPSLHIHSSVPTTEQLSPGCTDSFDRRASCIKTSVGSRYRGGPALPGSAAIYQALSLISTTLYFCLKCSKDVLLLFAGFHFVLYIKMETTIPFASVERQDLGFVSLDTFRYSTLLSRSKR